MDHLARTAAAVLALAALAGCMPEAATVTSAPRRHARAAVTVAPITARSDEDAQAIIDRTRHGRPLCHAALTENLVMEHGYCVHRAWYRLAKGALIHVTTGPAAGWYRVTGHATSTAASPDHTWTDIPPSAQRADLALAACLTETVTGFTTAKRVR